MATATEITTVTEMTTVTTVMEVTTVTTAVTTTTVALPPPSCRTLLLHTPRIDKPHFLKRVRSFLVE